MNNKHKDFEPQSVTLSFYEMTETGKLQEFAFRGEEVGFCKCGSQKPCWGWPLNMWENLRWNMKQIYM